MPGALRPPALPPSLQTGRTPLTDARHRTGPASRSPRARSSARLLAAPAVALLAALAAPLPAAPQQIAPVAEDADLPPSGEIRLRAGPYLQAWHQEFGPGPGGGEAVPLARDWSGPVLERVYPGPELLLEGVNDDAGALGFEPLSPDDASLGRLEMRELSAEIRTLAVRLEVGLPWGLSADAMVPLARTEVEPFGTFDPSGATLGSAGGIFESPGDFFDAVSSARSALQARLDAGEITGGEAEQARQLLEESGAFAGALEARVDAAALVPLSGTAAGVQLLEHYQGLRSGFSSFDLSLPELSLPAEAGEGLLDALPGNPLTPVQRGFVVGEPEFGLRLQLHDGFGPAGEGSGLEARTAVGIRARLPLRSGEASPFVRPDDLLGVAPGDGQRDLEVSLYQDLRWGDALTVDAVARYGLQRTDERAVRVRSPARPLAPPSTERVVEFDPGDYLRLRLAPRLVLNRFLSLGGEYRLWSKGDDRYRVLEGGGDAAALELETAGTRHRVGLGAFYRPDPPEPGETGAGAPELGVVWQTALAGSGGEVPAANLFTFHLRIPIHLF